MILTYESYTKCEGLIWLFYYISLELVVNKK